MNKAFFAAASRLVKSTDFNDLTWRWHGLGMLQADLDESLRVHIHHPRLRTIPPQNLRCVHDHRFDCNSAVIVGSVFDSPYIVLIGEEPASVAMPFFFQTEAFAIQHAKIQSGDDSLDVASLGVAWAREVATRELKAGEVYSIPRRIWHTSRVDALAVTLFHRYNFDDKPARILGSGKGAIVEHDIAWLIESCSPATRARHYMLHEVLDEASCAVHR